ncbi:MAG TPA: hypothetical protein VNV38_06655 [Stellaceae bacterium]|jgi:hypothetical protein|nr:hypothetical protein [Stellaceae bacterium]
MKWAKSGARRGLVAVLAALLCASCSFLPFQNEPSSALIGNWSDPDHNKVTFRADAVVLTPENGQPTTMGPGECNGTYKLQYGRMATADLQRSFSSQPDLQNKLKQLLTRPDYPVADVTCDQGGTTYLMLDDNRVLAVYRDAGIGGTQSLSRL